MPVSREEFEALPEATLDLSEEADARHVLSFLDHHPAQAFSREEVGEETGIEDENVGTVLNELEESGLVEHRGAYWAIGDENRIGSLVGMGFGFEVANDRYPPEDTSEWGEYAVEKSE